MNGNDLASAMKSLGASREQTRDALKGAKLDPDEIESILEIFTDGSTIIDRISDSFTGMGESLSKTLGGIKSGFTGTVLPFLKTNWVAVAAGLAAVTLAVVAYSNSFENLANKAETARTALQGTTAELTSLQNEKAANQQKIDELTETEESKESNAKAIAQLERENNLLEAKIALQERQQDIDEQASAKAAAAALTKMQTVETSWDQYESKDFIDITNDDMKKLDFLQEKQNEVADSIGAIKAAKEARGDGEYTKDEIRELNRLQHQYGAYQSQIDTLSSTITANQIIITDFYESLFDSEGNVIKGHEGLVERLEAAFGDSFLGIGDETPDKMQEIADSYSAMLDSLGVGDDQKSSSLKAMTDWLDGLSEKDQEIVYSIFVKEGSVESLTSLQEALQKTKELSSASDFSLDIAAEKSGIEALTSAINESTSATGLSAESISALKSRYADLAGYDASRLFENTTNGVHLNSEALSALEQEYDNVIKRDIASEMARLVDEYTSLEEAVKDFQGTSIADDFKNQRDAVLDKIESLERLSAQYSALTSDYAQWQNAMSTENKNAGYAAAGSQYKAMKAIVDAGWYGNDELNEYLDLMLGVQNRTDDVAADFARLNKNIAGTSNSLMDYWKFNGDTLVTDGLFDFLDDVNAKLGDSYAGIDENGKYFFDFSGDKLQHVADAFTTNTDLISLFAQATEEAGMAVNMGQDTFSDFLKSFSDTGDVSNITDGLSLDQFKAEIDSAKQRIESLKNEQIKAEGELDPAFEQQLDALIAKLQQEYYVRVNAETGNSLDKAVDIVKQIQEICTDPDTGEVKVDAEVGDGSEVDNLVSQLAEMPEEVQTEVGIEASNAGDAEKIMSQLQETPESITVPVNYEQTGSATAEDVKADASTATVNYVLGDQAPPVDMPAKVNYALGAQAPPMDMTATVNYVGSTFGGLMVNGTANAGGTALAGGNWGTAPGGKTLVGELGEEIVVNPHTGMWYTVGTNGAEFADIPKDAIVFNHIQSKALLENGSIVGRGKALVSGTALLDGSGGNRRPGSSGGSGGVSGSGGESASDTTDPTDWIEILIDRIERVIDRIARVAESAYKNLTSKTNATFEQIDKVTEEIGIQERSANRYLQEANSVGLSDDLAALVRNGSINIAQYDEDTQKKIEDYQNWYEKMLDCQDAAEELHETLAELYEANFENVQSDYEHQLEILEHQAREYEHSIDMLEAKGYLESKKYYASLQDIAHQNIAVLNKEMVDLTKAFDEAMASGEIEEGSDAWYEMKLAILDVQEQIDDANLSLIEYANTMREIEWGYFDFIQERIGLLTKESEFLIDLMEKSKLHDDQGQLTDEGMTTVGLHAMNYNTYMAQADKYAQEYKKIQEELANDPNNTKLIERRDELLELQQESVLSAEEEKEAIRDLVEEGINLELDALDELIEKYSDALDSAKDLYDYQNKISDHTSEISNLQKQLLAYENNTSEEAKAKVQELKVELEKAEKDLEETEYDKYIDDQKKLLDDLRIEYEEVLNQRLDNVDALLTDMIGAVNENSDSISATITEVANNVGYTLTDNMQSVWNETAGVIEGVVSEYGDGFNEQLTSINTVLTRIHDGVMEMVSDEKADQHIEVSQPSGIKKFASGGLADYTGMAWIDGTASNPEVVLDAQDSKNLIGLRDTLRELSNRNLTVAQSHGYNVDNMSHIRDIAAITPVLSEIRNQSHSGVSSSFGDINITIPIEHVDDYNDFVNQLRSDSKFEKMIEDITLCKMTGGSSLQKNRHRW